MSVAIFYDLILVCSRYRGKDEPVTERDPGEERAL